MTEQDPQDRGERRPGFLDDLKSSLVASRESFKQGPEVVATPAQAEDKYGPLVALPLEAVLDSAASYMTTRDFAVEFRSGNAATFTNYLRPNGLVGLILLLFFILPGVLYFILAGKHVRSTLVATAAPEGCHILIGGESRAGYNELNRWLKKLPRATSGEVLADVESAEAVSVPDQLRELAELRDAGIVTQVEFEAKKAELLKRM